MKQMNLAWRICLCIIICACIALGGKFYTMIAYPTSYGIAYKLQYNNNSMVLLGSIHMGTKAMTNWHPTLSNALDNSTTLVFECNTNDATSTTELKQSMYLPQGETLETVLTTECLNNVKLACEELGIPFSSLSNLTPWGLTNQLTLLVTAKEMGEKNLNTAIKYGIENQVQTRVLNKQINTLYLETVKEQSNYTASFSKDLVEYLLNQILVKIIKPNQTISNNNVTQWEKWWQAGDSTKFSDAYFESMEINSNKEKLLVNEYQHKLITSRNDKMASKIINWLEKSENENYFVVVGLLHLVLENDNIINRLQDYGIIVTPLH